MKRILLMAALAVTTFLGSAVPNDVAAQSDYYDDRNYDDGYYDDPYYDDRGDLSYQTFYDELSPHGNWVEYPGHGYVWQPRMGPDFRPYSTGGHWVWSDRYEWVWVSDYDWGWAPFHYGRWFHDPYYGWLWVPGYEWSGAWVSWRHGGDYYGWAPLRPGLSININFNLGGYHPPNDWWTFTPRRYILYRNWNNYCVDYRRNITVINHTTIINNYNYGDRYGFRTGPRRTDFERYTGRITPVRFRQATQPGRTSFRDNEVSVYRPRFRQQESAATNVRPRQFERFDRNRSNADGSVRSNDAGVRNNNGGFRDRERTDQPSNNLPRTREGNRRFERTDNAPPRQNGNTRPDFRKPRQQSPRTVDPGNTGTNNGNDRPRFEPRREPRVSPSTEQPRQRVERERSPQFERRPQPQRVEPQRAPQVERRSPAQQSTPRFERRSAPVQQQQPRQAERRMNPGGGNEQGQPGSRSPRRF